jgi:hypothetical protein
MIIQVNAINGYPSSYIYNEIKDAIWLVLELLYKIQDGDKKNAALNTILETSKFAERNEAYLLYLQGWLAREYPDRINIKILNSGEIQDMLKILKQENND